EVLIPAFRRQPSGWVASGGRRGGLLRSRLLPQVRSGFAPAHAVADLFVGLPDEESQRVLVQPSGRLARHHPRPCRSLGSEFSDPETALRTASVAPVPRLSQPCRRL